MTETGNHLLGPVGPWALLGWALLGHSFVGPGWGHSFRGPCWGHSFVGSYWGHLFGPCWAHWALLSPLGPAGPIWIIIHKRVISSNQNISFLARNKYFLFWGSFFKNEFRRRPYPPSFSACFDDHPFNHISNNYLWGQGSSRGRSPLKILRGYPQHATALGLPGQMEAHLIIFLIITNLTVLLIITPLIIFLIISHSTICLITTKLIRCLISIRF